jgi:hypothetical protein
MSNLVSEILHEPIEHVTVLLDGVCRFRYDVFSESLPCDDRGRLRWYRMQQLVTLTKVADLRIIFDKIGAFTGLLRNLSEDSAHRLDLPKLLVLCHEVVNFTQLLEKLEYRCVAIRLS